MAKNKYEKNQLNITINGNKALIKSKNNIYYRKINNIDGINRDENINKNYNLNDFYFDNNITTNDIERTLIKRNKSLNFIPLFNSSKQNLNKKDIFSNVSTEIIPSISDKNNNNMNLKNKTIIGVKKQ